MSETKTCSKCKIEYPIKAFYKHSISSSGEVKRSSNCKYCRGVHLPNVAEPLRINRLETTLNSRSELEEKSLARKNARQLKFNVAVELGKSITKDSGIKTKSCTLCKNIFTLEYFAIRKSRSLRITQGTPKSCCKFCDVEKAMRYSRNNREQSNATDRRYYQNNKTKFFTPEAKEKRKLSDIQFRLRNPELSNAWSSKRRAVKLRATPTWSNDVYIGIFFSMAHEAQIESGIKHQVDHIVPLVSDYVYGFHCEDNLQVLSATTNHEKSNSTWLHMFEITPELKKLMKDFNGTN